MEEILGQSNAHELTFRAEPEEEKAEQLLSFMLQDPRKGVETFAQELENSITPEMLKDIKGKKTREQCVKEARAAVSVEVMKRTDDYVKSLPEGGLDPLFKYTNKDEAGVNKALRKNTQTPEDLANIKALSTLLKNGPKYKGICFRGCYFDTEERQHNLSAI